MLLLLPAECPVPGPENPSGAQHTEWPYKARDWSLWNKLAQQSDLEQQPFLSLTVPRGSGTQPGGAGTTWCLLAPAVS